MIRVVFEVDIGTCFLDVEEPSDEEVARELAEFGFDCEVNRSIVRSKLAQAAASRQVVSVLGPVLKSLNAEDFSVNWLHVRGS